MNKTKLVGYVLTDYMRNGHTTRSLINVGSPLELKTQKVYSLENEPITLANGNPLTNSTQLRVYDSIRMAKRVAEKLKALRMNPAEFTCTPYNPDKDRYEIRVSPVIESDQGLTIGMPLIGFSHAMGTFGFRKNGKRVLTSAVKRRLGIHKNDKRIAKAARKAPEL